jgi:hypothetical protein
MLLVLLHICVLPIQVNYVNFCSIAYKCQSRFFFRDYEVYEPAVAGNGENHVRVLARHHPLCLLCFWMLIYLCKGEFWIQQETMMNESDRLVLL